jgi:hypothetical protein
MTAEHSEQIVANWPAILSVIVVFLSMITGAAWWMSALYSEVRSLNRTITAEAASRSKDNSLLWAATNRHAEKLQEHELRLTEYGLLIKSAAMRERDRDRDRDCGVEED